MHAFDLLGYDIEMFGRMKWHVHPTHRPDRFRPLARAINNNLRLDITVIGLHAGHDTIARADTKYAHALEDLCSTHAGTFSERLRHVGWIGGAIKWQPNSAD